jgi:hypothetical protein
MRQHKKTFTTLLLIICALIATAITPAVASAATSLPSGLLIADSDGMRVPVTGEYFIDLEGLEAGDIITKQLVIQNTESYPYLLSMTATPLEETGPIKLLDEVRCTLSLDGRTLYDGRIRGDEGTDMIRQALSLGTIPSGGQRVLEITITVSSDMPKHYWTASEALFKWDFHATQEGKTDDVKTGQMVDDTLVMLLALIIVLMLMLVIIKKRREQQEEEERLREEAENSLFG